MNKIPKEWPDQLITGNQIRSLAGSTEAWVVNQIVPGPGEDPQIESEQKVDLDETAPPPGGEFETNTTGEFHAIIDTQVTDREFVIPVCRAGGDHVPGAADGH